MKVGDGDGDGNRVCDSADGGEVCIPSLYLLMRNAWV